MSHEARAVRRNGPGRVWFAECPDGCILPDAHSKEQAALEAMKHRVNIAASQLRCDCYWPDQTEYGGNYPCPRCQLIEALGVA